MDRQLVYKIMWQKADVHKRGESEEIDETDTKSDAQFLVREYRLSHGGRVWYKKAWVTIKEAA